jgi:hypothetical protein
MSSEMSACIAVISEVSSADRIGWIRSTDGTGRLGDPAAAGWLPVMTMPYAKEYSPPPLLFQPEARSVQSALTRRRTGRGSSRFAQRVGVS